MTKAQDKTRVEWIDMVKGITISLVVFNHTSNYLNIDYPLQQFIWSIQMPVFYMISGLFFKKYDDFKGFIVRKINQLLVPYTFFLIVTSLLPFCIYHNKNILEGLTYVYFSGPPYNYAIWFLLSLFEVYLSFYFIITFINLIVPSKSNNRTFSALVLFCCIMIGICGLILSYLRIDLPLFIDSSMTAMPLFAFGWWIKNHTDLFVNLQTQRNISWILVVFCFLMTLLLISPLDYSTNEFSTKGYFCTYLCAVVGLLSLCLLSINIKNLKISKIIKYLGVNSLSVLCIHMPILLVVSVIAKRYSYFGIPYLILVFVVAMLLCKITMPLLHKFLPYVTNQKQLFNYGHK